MYKLNYPLNFLCNRKGIIYPIRGYRFPLITVPFLGFGPQKRILVSRVRIEEPMQDTPLSSRQE